MEENNFRAAVGGFKTQLADLSAVAGEMILSLAVATIARAGLPRDVSEAAGHAEQLDPTTRSEGNQEVGPKAGEERVLIERKILLIGDRVSAQRRLVQRLERADDAPDELRVATDLLLVLETELEALNKALSRLTPQPVHQA